ncbi:MAG TPA: hypothetical protein VLI93_11670 [Acetobacteraceae bacterium]|nr:hypothetical protein [Acetobacteraceae bacterium]
MKVGPTDQPEVRKKAFAWLAHHVNTFVNVDAPSCVVVADYQSRGD